MTTANAPTMADLQAERRQIEAQLLRGRAAEDAIERYEAQAEEPRLRAQLLRLDAAIAREAQAQATAREAEKLRVHDAAAKAYGARAPGLMRAARAFQAEMLAWAAIEEREHVQSGDYVDRLVFVDFLESSADGTFTSRVDTLEATLRARGLLPADAPPTQRVRGA